jgi:hypothetical protein
VDLLHNELNKNVNFASLKVKLEKLVILSNEEFLDKVIGRLRGLEHQSVVEVPQVLVIHDCLRQFEKQLFLLNQGLHVRRGESEEFRLEQTLLVTFRQLCLRFT